MTIITRMCGQLEKANLSHFAKLRLGRPEAHKLHSHRQVGEAHLLLLSIDCHGAVQYYLLVRVLTMSTESAKCKICSSLC